ncbi:hypothetical protein F4861DRAFT_523819 [Xylaria intraflava]|nr:hypothetical protein F4861DRAFT_523819 [Xylaria intraflava]
MRNSPTLSPLRTEIPFSALDWRRAINEVKRKYLARKYRSCSMQCCEMLDNLPDRQDVQPLYLIYLYFYAAASFERCAWSISLPSAYRTRLLCDAQTHYAKAEGLLIDMEYNLAEGEDLPSSISRGGLTCPGLSASSRTSRSNSTASSPRTSVFSLDEEVPAKHGWPVPVKPKKKVSFSTPPEFVEFHPEPYIRQDSPTLGWGDDVYQSPHEMHVQFPTPPKMSMPTSIVKLSPKGKMTPSPTATAVRVKSNNRLQSNAGPTTTATPNLVNKNITANHDYIFERSTTPSHNAFDLECFVQTRNVNRVRVQLSELRSQICHHRAAVDDLLGALGDTPTTPTRAGKSVINHQAQKLRPAWSTSPPASSKPVGFASRPESNSYRPQRPALHVRTEIADSAVGTYRSIRNSQSLPTLSHQVPSPAYPYDPTVTTGTIPTPTSSRERSLQDRIERLRESGWQRKRFDNQRYKDLREQVLSELEACC